MAKTQGSFTPRPTEDLLSPFKEVLNTNYAPVASEVVEIQELLRLPKRRLEELIVEKARLEAMLQALREEEDKIKNYIETHIALTSPIRRVPDDIVREIFIQCLNHPFASTFRLRGPQLLLGHVCKRWRTILFDTPTMWRTLVLVLGGYWLSDTTSSAVEQDIVALRRWLTRSAELFVSVVVIRRSVTDLPEGVLKAYMDTILSFSRHFRELTVYLHTDEDDGQEDVVQDSLFSLTTDDLPLLRALSVTVGFRSGSRTSPQWIQCELFAGPELRSLSLQGTRHPIAETKVNWVHLTHLSINLHYGNEGPGITATEAHKVLIRCHSLKLVTMSLVDDDEDIGSHGQVDLPFLETLELSETSTSVTQLLCTLNVPLLRSLQYVGHLSVERRSPLIILLERWGQTVQDLKIDVFTFTMADVVECLRLVPSATHITHTRNSSGWPIEFLNPLPTVLELLAWRGDDERTFCPRLQVLQFKRGIQGQVDVRRVLKFVESRMNIPAPTLREVDFAQVSGGDVDDLSRTRELFQPFITQGLRVFLNSSQLE